MDPRASTPAIEGLLEATRAHAPPREFRTHANVHDASVYTDAERDPEGFWSRLAGDVAWRRKWDRVRVGEFPDVQWFVGGKLNVTESCVDRWAATQPDKVAIVAEGEPGEVRRLTYAELSREVQRAANALRSLGVEKGDRVGIYLPMIAEAAIAMLACARIGAVHSVVFGGFSTQSLKDRLNDAEAKVLITADGGYRRGNVVPLKLTADEALASAPSVEKVLVVRRTGQLVPMNVGRDVWWHDALAAESDRCPAVEVDAEDPFFILYTSGSTGKPKGVLHTTGGYLVGVHATTRMILDVKREDVYFCTADVGWITGHSYVVYGPLSNGATTMMYEGAPDWPDKDRFWHLVEKHRATILYTAPTAIRAFMKWGPDYPAKHDLASLRLLGTVGEPINPEAWEWYHRHIGHGRCPVVDTWWQTETGMILLSTLPGVDEMRPGFAGRPFPGVEMDLVNEAGESVTKPGDGGYLVIRTPWPAMFRTLWRDPARYREEYFSRFPGAYFPKDGAKRDARGYTMILGRVDDVIKVSGHRLGTMEIESALVDHPAVAEAAVVGRADEARGEAIVAYVILRKGVDETSQLARDLAEHVAKTLGAIARPAQVVITPDLPKTRSGKIMRRLLRDVAEGRPLGDVTTLADPSVPEMLAKKVRG